jgi:hypothetical protein
MSAWEGSASERQWEESAKKPKPPTPKNVDFGYTSLADRITALTDAHGSLRQLADALGEDAGYLSRLRSGEKDNPSDEVLQKLGLVKVVKYQLRHTR